MSSALGPARGPNGLEVRSAIEFRASGRRLEGYAAAFNSPTRIGGDRGFEERVMPGAFRESLAGGLDVLALVDHDPTRLLARTGSGTLRLAEDSRGLAFSLDVPGTSLGNDILALAERRDLGGMSFGFRVRPSGERWPAADKRELHGVSLIEISIVQGFPAYSQTSVAARSRCYGEGWGPSARRRRLARL